MLYDQNCEKLDFCFKQQQLGHVLLFLLNVFESILYTAIIFSLKDNIQSLSYQPLP